jgi:KipI family sensor histidine kinase inhibitor
MHFSKTCAVNSTRMRIVPASDSSLFVSFGDAISRELNVRVIALFRSLQSTADTRIRNLHPAYCSLLIDFDPLLLTHEELEAVVRSFIQEPLEVRDEARRMIEIPVCYDAAFAPDLPSAAKHLRITEEQLITKHCAGEYFVCFLGFSPGFAYLGGLIPDLQVPRHATPRKLVSAGSLGLAGLQTGIYPHDSPGGWQLIGRTPLRMFDPSADPPSRLLPGDEVRFRRIDREEFDRMANPGKPS